MDRSMMNYPPGDPSLVDKIVCQLKSQGIFDRFRKECIADVDTKPAYQNLHQRVEGTVAGFLANQEWRPELNKNQLRDSLRKHVHESGFLDIGVERIVDQVVNPKILTVLLPQIEDVVYNFLGLEKPKKKFSQNVASLQAAKSFKPLKMETLEDLLPKDLDPISPGSVGVNSDEESEFNNVKKEAKDEVENEEERLGEDEDSSPPFEPIEKIGHNENSLDSHISGISGLTSHDSQMSNLSFGKAHPDEEAQSFQKAQDMDLSNHDSQLSKVSSGSRLSIVFSDDQQKVAKRTSPASSDMDIQNEDSQISNIIEAVEPNPQNMQEFDTKEESKEFSHDFDCAATKELPSKSNDDFICERVNESSNSKVQTSADVDGSNLTFEIVEVPKEKELEDRDLEEKQTEKQDDLKHTFVSIDSHEPMHIEYTSHSSDCEQQKLEREKSSIKTFKVDGKDGDKDDVQVEKDQHENKLVENGERKDQEEIIYPFSKDKNATEEKVVQSADVTKGYEQTEGKESEKQREKYRADSCDVSKDKGKHDEKDVGKEKGKIDDKGDRGKSEKGLKESSKEKNKIDDKSEKDLSKRSHHNDKKIESTKDRCRNEEKEVYKEKCEKEGSKEEYKDKLEKEASKEKPEKEGSKEKYEKGSKEKAEKVYKEKLEKEGTKEKSEKEGCKEKLEKEGSKDKSEKEGSKEKRHSDKANVIKDKIKNNDKEKQKDEKGERKTDEKFRKDPAKDKTKIEKNERESSRDRSKHDGKQDRNRSKHDRKDDRTKSDERSKRNDKDGGKEKMKRDGDTAKSEEGDEEKKNRNKDSRKEKIKEKTSRHDEKCKNEEKSKEQKYEFKENAKQDVKSPNEKSNRDSKSKTKVEVKEKDSKKEERIKDRSKDDKSDKERAEEKVEREKSRDERSSRHKRKEEKPREEKSEKENSKSDRSDRSKSRDERSEREKSKEEKGERSSKSSHEPKKNDRDSNKSRNNSSGSGDKAKNERKKDNKAKDDHSSHRERRPDDRRSADRDSNGHSASSSSSTHATSSAASTHVSRRHDRRTTGRSDGGEAPADPEGNVPTDRTHDVHIHAHALPIKKRPVQSPDQARERKDNDKHLKRPKIAANIYEARKIMQQRKLERRRQREEERAASLPDDGDLTLSSDGEELRFFEEAETRVDKVFLQFVKGLEESETLSELADSADEDALVSVGRLSPSSSLSEGLHVSTEPTGDTLSGSEIHDVFGRSPARESRSGTPSTGPSPPKRFISQSAGYKGDVVDDGPRIRIQPSSGDRQERRKRDHHHMRRFMVSRESRSTKGGFATASEGDDSSGSTHFTPPDVGAVLGVDSGLNVGTSKARNQLAAEVAPLRGRPPKRRGTSASPAPSPSPSPAPSAVSVSAPTSGEAVPKRPTLASDVVGGIVAPEEAPRVGSDPPTPGSRLLCPRSTPPLLGMRKPLPHTKTHSPGIISYGGFIPKEIVEVKVLDVSGEAEDVKENNVDKSSSDDEKGSGEDTLSNELISSALRDLMMESGLNLGASVAVAATSKHEDGGVDSSTTSATDVHAPASTPTHEAGPSPDQSPAMDDAGPGRRAKIGRGRRLGLPRPLRRLSGQSSPLTGSNKEGTPSSPDCDTSSTPPPQDSKATVAGAHERGSVVGSDSSSRQRLIS